MNFWLGVISIIGGAWITQDALASILYYLKRDNEKWYYNHLVRLLRGLWGLVFIGIGIYLLLGGR